MEDEAIIELYWRRDEDAIRQTEQKYGRLCRTIAGNILASREDCEECVNDTWLGLWGAIPPKRPYRLSAFAGRITRNLALKRYAYLSAARRNPEAVCSLEELGECVSGADCVESEMESRRVRQALNDFLWSQEEDKRLVFLRRYWYFDGIGEICRRTGYSPGKVKSMLYQTRKKLRAYLEKEGITL